MGKGQPVNLPSISFSTKTKAKEFFCDMLKSYVDGQKINYDDHEILYELLLRHRDANKKIGNGIEQFYRQKSPDHPTSCFHLKRIDGSTTDFSYGDCIKRLEPTTEQYFYRACRQAVSLTLTRQKNEMFAKGTVYCFKTKKLVTKETSELRHTDPIFSQIVKNFKEQYNLIINESMFLKSADMQYSTSFIDNDLKNKFIDFHQEIAHLEIFKKYER